ncbi:HlyD family efflux transporter periplasmic adaptor subunit [Starkeya sp. ORNL1]|uniref:HlyD family secretion protein n=1 Tax=Starkeya sp. ORNL1 TaxID=2709380 RepID=UPI001462B06F|nr:HlyD family efflux transporter periplasmic adaptor subunit [Starkeya sp. ORNL1]QJP12434.1 HlyD family efflux transporter periplasmic adaptor subunit [Starkeya sp. ORNL1]
MMRPVRALAIAAALALAACGESGPPRFQGYAESDLIFVGPDEAGRVIALYVDEGAQVKPGDKLFEVEADMQEADVASAKANLAQAQAQLDNLQAATQRPEEIAVLKASERRAATALDMSRIELGRQAELTAKKVGSQAALDDAQHTFDQNQAALDEIRRQIDVGNLAARDQQIAAAEHAVGMAQANLAAAQTRLDRRKLAAKVEGSVETVYFRPGELVPAGRPVVSILPPNLIKVRFFAPEPDLPRFRMGTKVSVTCDGCSKPIPATVSFIAASAEYTPPVIYSLDERAKLVFMLEARPDDANALRPGQPVTVEVAPGGAP